MKRLFYIILIVLVLGASVLYLLTPRQSNLAVLLYFSCVGSGVWLRQSYLTLRKNVKQYNTLCNDE